MHHGWCMVARVGLHHDWCMVAGVPRGCLLEASSALEWGGCLGLCEGLGRYGVVRCSTGKWDGCTQSIARGAGMGVNRKVDGRVASWLAC